MNVRKEIDIANDIERKQRETKIAEEKAEELLLLAERKKHNHIIFNKHKYITFIGLDDYISLLATKSVYTIYNKRIYKLAYKYIGNNNRVYKWVDLFKNQGINSKFLVNTTTEFKTLSDYLKSKNNPYRNSYMFTASSNKYIIGLLYDMTFNGAKQQRLYDNELTDAFNNKLITKTMYNRLIKNNNIVGFTNEFHK